MRLRNNLTIAVVSVLIAGCHNASTSSQSGGGSQTSGGAGSATVVNLKDAAASPGPKIIGTVSGADPGRVPDLPSRPTLGTRHLASAAPRVTPQAIPINPCTIAVSPCAFDGIAEETEVSCNSCWPPDPNAAVGAGEIVEVVNSEMRVTDKSGAVLCGNPVGLAHFLRTTDVLTDPHVQFDNVNQRFSFVITVKPASQSATPALWVAASDSSDACGTWRTGRLTFHGDLYPNGTFLDYPILGQDTHALLISTRNVQNGKIIGYTVFGLPKSTIYAGTHVEFNCFQVSSLTAPVANAGQPMIASPVSFFLAAVPATGYKLYRLTNSGGPGAKLTETDIKDPFDKPSRRANQPNTTVTIDPSDGSILNSPTFDGTFIWFTHTVDYGGFPTVRYGAVDTTHNTDVTAYAFHSETSDDFVPSIAVSITSAGETLFLNWAFTDTPAVPPIPESDVVVSTAAAQRLPSLLGGTVYASGGNLGASVNGPTGGPTRFGDFSSVSMDPATSGCAIATHEYFADDGSWKTRVAPAGHCENTVIHP